MKFFAFDEEKNKLPYSRKKLAAGENVMVDMVEAPKGASERPHSHDHEQVILVLRGSWRFHMNGREFTVGANQSLSIPARVEHWAIALEDTLAVDICAESQPERPTAEDWPAPYDADQYLWGV